MFVYCKTGCGDARVCVLLQMATSAPPYGEENRGARRARAKGWRSNGAKRQGGDGLPVVDGRGELRLTGKGGGGHLEPQKSGVDLSKSGVHHSVNRCSSRSSPCQ